MYMTVLCVARIDGCIFWEFSQSNIDEVLKYFKEDGPGYKW